jgi:hypothetical protein
MCGAPKIGQESMTRLRRALAVAALELDGTVYAAYLPDGPIAVLDGVAGLVWAEACAGERTTIAERVAEATDVAADEIRDEVDAFVSDLMTRGLLMPEQG